jgi:type IV secretory pathway component VirB8
MVFTEIPHAKFYHGEFLVLVFTTVSFLKPLHKMEPVFIRVQNGDPLK